jgi:hypothetical protein
MGVCGSAERGGRVNGGGASWVDRMLAECGFKGNGGSALLEREMVRGEIGA